MTDPKLHELLNQAKFGDQLAIAHRSGKLTARISGPVLAVMGLVPGVAIDLLDGQPHVVRSSTGIVWGPVAQAALHRGGELVAEWDAADHLEAQQTSQPATAPPAAQQDDSGHEGETGHEDQYETDFDRWLSGISPGQREQITRDIEAAHDLIRDGLTAAAHIARQEQP